MSVHDELSWCKSWIIDNFCNVINENYFVFFLRILNAFVFIVLKFSVSKTSNLLWMLYFLYIAAFCRSFMLILHAVSNNYDLVNEQDIWYGYRHSSFLCLKKFTDKLN